MLQDLVERGRQRIGHLHRDDVRARHHDLAHDRVAELEDRVDHPALRLLDAPFLMADFGHRADVLLRDERALLEPLPRQQDVRHRDQQPRRHGERPAEHPDERRQRERRPVAVQDAVRLRHGLDHDEVDDREHGRDERQAEIADPVRRRRRHEDGGPVLHEHDRQVDRVQIPRRLRLDRLEQPGVPPARLLEGKRPHQRHAAGRRLRHRQHRPEHQQHQDHRDGPDHLRHAQDPRSQSASANPRRHPYLHDPPPTASTPQGMQCIQRDRHRRAYHVWSAGLAGRDTRPRVPPASHSRSAPTRNVFRVGYRSPCFRMR